MPGVAGLIRDDHNRVRRLFSALDDVARYAATGGSWMLGRTWARLADLLESHGMAEETCRLAGARRTLDSENGAQAAAPDYSEVREAVRQAGLHEVGCKAWWHAVATAREAAIKHIDHAEQGTLASYGRLRDPLAQPAGRRAQHWPSVSSAQDLRDQAQDAKETVQDSWS
jgi:hypothetical protein